MAMFSKDLGIDLGTMFTRLADGTQVLLEEPTIVAIEVHDHQGFEGNRLLRTLNRAGGVGGFVHLGAGWMFHWRMRHT